MKVYALKSGNLYIGSRLQALKVQYWNGKMDIHSVSDISEARHYKIKSQATGYANNIRERLNVEINKIKEKIKGGNQSSYYLKDLKDNLKIAETQYIPFVNAIVVEEHEVEDLEDTNVPSVKNKRLEFHSWYSRNPRFKGFKIHTETTKRHHCKCCGVYLKNIPQLNVNGIYGSFLCVRCVARMGEEAKRIWEELPNKAELESEFFMENL